MTAYVLDPTLMVPGNRIRVLRDAGEAYPRMLEAIAAAKHSILVEMYIFANDDIGWQFARALADRARAGVQVRVIYDVLGSKMTTTDLWSHLRLAGAAVTPYRPLGWFSFFTRDHRKLIIIDGQLSFAGGLNIYGEKEWRDTHLEIDGPLSAGLVEIFRQTWVKEEDDALWRPDPPPAPEPRGAVAAGVFAQTKWGDRWSIARAYIHAIKQAKQRIWITNAYFMPSLRFLRALRRAAKRGVDVRVLLPSESDVWPVKYASQYLYGGLLRNGIRIFEWQGKMLHSKTAVIDGIWSTVGSYNLDHLSFARNLEATICLEDPEIGGILERMYEDDLRNSREITPGEWRKRPFYRRINEWFWHIFQSIL